MLKANLINAFYGSREFLNRVQDKIVEPSNRFGRVLTYHRVTDARDPLDRMSISCKQFENQIIYLKSEYVIKPLYEFEILRRNARLTGAEVALTFDDGYHDNLSEMLPIIQQHKIPVTIFCNTGYPGEDAFFDWNITNRPKAKFFKYDEILTISESPFVEIHAHTHTHKRMRGRLDRMKTEISENIRVLKELKFDPKFLAYPFGRRLDVSWNAQKITAQNFIAAYSNEKGFCHERSHQHFLPRFNIQFDNFEKIFN